ncbi:N-acetylmuramoyl-L-alanine amidase [Streptococcus sp. DD10]|nr:N-acetylmuramoyl-L-alanine amidase [Streptococcus sp. DD10]
MIWYKASKQANGDYKVTIATSNHKADNGRYHSHVYLIDSQGASQGLGGVQSVFNITQTHGDIEIDKSNINQGMFDVVIKNITTPNGLKEVTVPVWSDVNGQDDLEWYTASKQTNGTYKTTVRLSNHQYINGLYHIHLYYRNNANKLEGVGATTTTVQTPAPRAFIEREMNSLMNEYNRLFGNIGGQKSLYISPVDGTEYRLVNDSVQPSASSIKLFVLAAAYAKAARGELNLQQRYTVQQSDIIPNQAVTLNLYGKAGSNYNLDQLLHFMTSTSDNSATNIIIRHIGGVDAVNNEIRRLGYNHSTLNRYMYDSAAISRGVDNYISAQESGDLIKNIYNGTLIDKATDAAILEKLAHNVHNYWLTANIRDKAQLWEKPGGSPGSGTENDTAIIKKNNRAYAVSLLTYGATNQNSAIKQFGEKFTNIL